MKFTHTHTHTELEREREREKNILVYSRDICIYPPKKYIYCWFVLINLFLLLINCVCNRIQRNHSKPDPKLIRTPSKVNMVIVPVSEFYFKYKPLL